MNSINTRIDEIHQIGALIAKDAVMVPLFQFPNLVAWRRDKLDGPVDQDAANFQAFQNWGEWRPTSGTQITIGPSSGRVHEPDHGVRLALRGWCGPRRNKVLNNVWDITSTGQYVPTSLVAGEPSTSEGAATR